MGDAMEYMPKDERKAAKDADPVVVYRDWLLANGHATEENLASIEEIITAAIDDAVEFAMNSPFPDAAELYTDVYAEAQK
jgi:pyruvate dehydrogenase E1 component alpha subunit